MSTILGWLVRCLLAASLLVALAGCTRPATPLTSAPQALPGATSSADTPTPAATPSVGQSSGKTKAAPTIAPGAASPASFLGDAPDRDLYRLAAQLSPGGAQGIGRVVNPEPVSYSEGRLDTFWLVDFQDIRVYQRRFELRLVTPRAYWYVEEGLSVRQPDLARAAAIFEEQIYPRVSAAFGQEWLPGVDNDPHLNILHARLRGVGGYFSSSDEYPQSVYRYSNQRETIYLNTGSLPVGSKSYLEALAHELQHAIHWNGDPSEDTWVNEGLSELAVRLAGYRPESIGLFLQSPATSLVHWPLEPLAVEASYGAAALFMHYLWEHYPDPDRGGDLRRLVAEPADAIAGIEAYLRAQGRGVTFPQVFRDWVVANFLDESPGVYGYGDPDPIGVGMQKILRDFAEVRREVPQYAAEYIELAGFQGPLRLRFRGVVENTLIPVEVGEEGCWWSNSGDSIGSTLTRAIDLTGLEVATLSYQVWYQVEKGWDYGYVQVSLDEGETWHILATPHTSPENPIGNAFGPGYTGQSEGWVYERVDLTPYAGKKIGLRFQYVTDDAINGAGLCLRRISVPGAPPWDRGQGWQAEGFIHTDNRVRQQYIVQVIQVGEGNRVTELHLDAANAGELVIPNAKELRRLVVVVAALAPKTRQPAPYTLAVEPAL